MGTAVIRSHDCLRTSETLRPTFSVTRSPVRGGRRKWRCREGLDDCRAVVRVPYPNFVEEKVTIPNRGKPLKPSPPSATPTLRSAPNTATAQPRVSDDVLSSKQRLGQDPDLVAKQVRLPDPLSYAAAYAGSAFATSPSPSSLPFPAFYARKEAAPRKSTTDLATEDLRRLLRLDLL